MIYRKFRNFLLCLGENGENICYTFTIDCLS